MRRNRKLAQSTAEYVMIVSLVIAALLSMVNILSHLNSGRLQKIQDYVTEWEPPK